METKQSRPGAGKNVLWRVADVLLVGSLLSGGWFWYANRSPKIETPAPVALPSPNGYDAFVLAGSVAVKNTEVADAIRDKVATYDTDHPQPYTQAEREQLIAENQAALQMLRQGLSAASRTPVVAFDDKDTTVDYARIRGLARLLSVEAKTYDGKGQYGQAANSCLDSIQMGTSLMHGASLLPFLVGTAVDAIGAKPQFARVDNLTAPEARQVIGRLEPIIAERPLLADVMENEQVQTEQELNRRFQQGNLFQIVLELREAEGDNSQTPLTLRQKTELMFQTIPVTKASVLANYRAYMTAMKARSAQAVSLPFPAAPTDPVNMGIMPVMEKAVEKDQQMRSTEVLLLTKLALHAYRLEHGAYPTTLDELVSAGILKAVPVDPYSPESSKVGYTPLPDNQYRLWSVGPDGKDDKGTPQDNRNSDGTYRSWCEPGKPGDFVVGVHLK